MSHRTTRTGNYPRNVALLALLPSLAFCAAVPSRPSLAGEAVPAAGASRAERKVRLDFVQAAIGDVVKALSIQSGVNIVLMPSVSGAVTVRLIDLSLEDALKKVAAAVGANVYRFDSTYFIGTTTELRAMVARDGVKETVLIKHLDPGDAKGLLEKAFPFLSVDALGKSNMLVMVGTRDDVAAALLLAKHADEAATPPPPAPVVPVKPIVLRDTYTVKWAQMDTLVTTLGRAMPELKVTPVETPTSRTLVLEGTVDQQAQAVKLLGALDTQGTGARVVRAYNLKYLHPHQVSNTLKGLFPNLIVQAGFESYSPTRAQFLPLGVDVSKALNNAGLQGGTQNSSSGGASGGGGAAGGAGGGVDLNGPGSRSRVVHLVGDPRDVDQATAILVAQDIPPMQVAIEARMVDISPEAIKRLGFTYSFQQPGGFTIGEPGSVGRVSNGLGSLFRDSLSVNIEALEQNREAKVLARPNISVVDGEEASIFIGDILRFERLEAVTLTGPTFTIETVPVGVALLCRPRVNDGRITLRVHPVVSTVTSFTGRNRDIPITSSREAESVIMMNDGETIAIGGLLREEDIKVLSKVPFLGNLPIIGELFRHRDYSKRKSEVTIFLTARVMKSS